MGGARVWEIFSSRLEGVVQHVHGVLGLWGIV